MLSYTGRMMLYYNHHNEAPRVWCIRAGEWELCVVTINATGVDMESKYQRAAPPGERDEWRPSAWFECHGQLTVSPEGHAIITPGSVRTFLDEPTVKGSNRL